LHKSRGLLLSQAKGRSKAALVPALKEKPTIITKQPWGQQQGQLVAIACPWSASTGT
jgi:hypothetical protein